MAESTLTLAFKELTAEVGQFLGYGRGADFGEPAWDTRTKGVIDSSVRSGLRQFYFPPPIEGQETSYDWSFLRPMATLQLASGAKAIPLPDDFGGFEGQLLLQASTQQIWFPVDLTGIGKIYEMYALYPQQTGKPLMACLEPLKGTTGTQGQRFQLDIFPIADMAYTVQFTYYVNPDCLTGAFPYAYGGPQHSETILESCLSIAEQRLDDSMTVHTAKFKERLLASISMDRRNKAQTFGYNRDFSDRRQEWNRSEQHGQNLVTVYGVQH